MKKDNLAPLVEAMHHVLVSPNVPDENGEPANLVDVGHEVALGLHQIAQAIERLADVLQAKGGK